MKSETPGVNARQALQRILLINPDCGGDEAGIPQSLRQSIAARWSPFQIGVMPLGLATIAALTPQRIKVDIWDEAVDGPITPAALSRGYDLAGVTGYVNHGARMNEIGAILSHAGIPGVAGGPGVSSEPEMFRRLFNTLFIGEAEYTWPQFIADYEAGIERAEYRQVGKVEMNHSPAPRWDSVRLESYLLGAVQTTRGCPFDCEFCDVIYIYGRRARHKSVDQVLDEVRSLEKAGIERLLFCDDNFIGNLRYAKELLRALCRLNATFHRPLAFFTNVTLNIARDQELLELLADANFCGVFIGIESPDLDSLVEMNKPQNHTIEMLEAVKRIHSYGIVIQSGMIAGFDHDDPLVFDRHFRFLQESGVPVPMINLLKAPTGTRLWLRLHKEGRVFQSAVLRNTSNVEPFTNILPKSMSLVELLDGYISLVERLRDWNNFEERVRRLVSHIRRRPTVHRRVEARKVLLLLVMLKTMNREARRTAVRLLWHTLWRAPFMAESVMGAVAYQYQEALRVPQLKKLIRDQIRQLNDGEIDLQIERTVFTVPEVFKNAYLTIFADLHTRLYEGLKDKSRTEPALVEVTSDFLARWATGFHRFESHHRASLEELCNRTIAAENSAIVDSRILANAHVNAPLRGLAQEVLRSAEQDLRGTARA